VVEVDLVETAAVAVVEEENPETIDHHVGNIEKQMVIYASKI
jgi:hypothetical protein